MSDIFQKSQAALRTIFHADPPASPAGTAADIFLGAPDVMRDPFPHYEALRQSGPVQFLPRHGFWIVLGYEEAKLVLKEHDTFSSCGYAPVDAVLLGADPPQHTAIRRIVTGFFSPETLNRLSLLAEERAVQLLRPEFDAVEDFSLPLVSHVAAELIGIRGKSLEAIQDATASVRAEQISFQAFLSLLDPLVEHSSLYQRLLALGSELISEPEARSLARILWIAATQTTERAIVWSVLSLLQNDSIRRDMRRPELLSPFIEEVLRLHPPESMLFRITRSATSLGGVKIPAGARVQVSLNAVNRDPKEFEDPAAIRLDRKSNRHLSFGFGVHQCVGAALGRQVTAAALRVLLRDAPQFQAGEPLADIAYRVNMTTLTPKRLIVRT